MTRFPRVDALLLLAVVAAVALALSGVLDGSAGLAAGAVATVNGKPIGADAFAAQLEAVTQQLGRAPDAPERGAILERVIEQELLLQQGLALELPRKDARLRTQLVQEVIAQALAESARQPVTEGELRAFHAAEAGFFRRPASYRVLRFDCRDAAEARALQAALGAGGELSPQLRSMQSALLPDAWLSGAKLGDYLGTGLARSVTSLAPGQSLLDEGAHGVSVLLLVAMEPPRDLAFEEIRAAVEAQLRRRRDEAALAAYVAKLRAAADVRIGGAGG